MSEKISKVALAAGRDRTAGVKASIRALGFKSAKNKDVLLKPNFNTADRVPGSTHNDTLGALIDELWSLGARSITLGERSYPPTGSVMEQKGVLPLLKMKDVKVLDFDILPPGDWIEIKPEDSHWKKGFRIARPILEAECLVYTCCLKTHQFGGVFTLSLKLSVGVVPTFRNGFDYMSELHGSPHQRKLIAEINQPFKPDLIVLDGVEAFVDGGPATGRRADGNLFLAAADRVAMDAVGVAALKNLGSNDQIMKLKIFEQEQIARAAALGLGASAPGEIEIVPADESSRDYAGRLTEILHEG